MDFKLRKLEYNMYDDVSNCEIKVTLSATDMDGSKITFVVDGVEAYSLVIAKTMALQKSDDELIGHAARQFMTDSENWVDIEAAKKLAKNYIRRRIITKIYVFEYEYNGVTFTITSTSFAGTDAYELVFENSLNTDRVSALCHASSESELLDNLVQYSHIMGLGAKFFKAAGGQYLTVKRPSHPLITAARME